MHFAGLLSAERRYGRGLQLRQFGCKVQKDKADETAIAMKRWEREAEWATSSACTADDSINPYVEYLEDCYLMAEKHIFVRQVVFFLGLAFFVMSNSDDTCSASS